MQHLWATVGVAVLLLGFGGCSDDDADDDAGCETEARNLVSFVREHKACVHDTQCTTVSVPCAVLSEHCSGAYAISTHDSAALEVLVSGFSTCKGGCGSCVAGAPDPVCLDGQCSFPGELGLRCGGEHDIGCPDGSSCEFSSPRSDVGTCS